MKGFGNIPSKIVLIKNSIKLLLEILKMEYFRSKFKIFCAPIDPALAGEYGIYIRIVLFSSVFRVGTPGTCPPPHSGQVKEKKR